MRRKSSEFIYGYLDSLFPNAGCELNYQTTFQLLVAVVLSAQTTDKSVNKVTVELFEKYPDAFSLASGDIKDVERIIHNIGLYRNKAKNIIALSKQLVEDYNGEVPSSREELTKLAGVGRKSANVILAECFKIDAIAVDTHVERIAKRLYIAYQNDDILTVEKKMMNYFPKSSWRKVHHLFIHFGRYKCSARNPKCQDCLLKENCYYYKHNNKI